MNVYLIKPKFPVTYWGFEYANDLSGVQYTSPPLSLATIAALTPPDIDVEICDENIEAIDYDKECDIVGLTAYLMQGPRAFQIAAEFRKRGKFVVLGGPITGLNLEDCRDKADVLFVGEAEYTWKQFIEDYRHGVHKSEYVQSEKVSMHDSPIPRMDLLQLDKYIHATIQTTRGCPFGCEFCDIVVLFGHKVRSKKVPQVLDEIREAAKQPIDSIFFTDDNFIGNKHYAKELLRAIIEFNKTLKMPFEYMTQVSINLARDEELLDLFHQANFTRVFIGIETPRKASLQEVNKGQNIKTDLLSDVKKIHSYNISVAAGMIVGFDHDDLRIFQEQLDFIMDANIPWAMTGILQAVPKTPLYKRLQAENRLDTSAEYFEVDNTALDINIIPKNMTKKELVKGYTWLLRQLYSYENYAKRVIGCLDLYSKQSQRKFSLPTLRRLITLAKALKYFLLTLDSKRRKFFLDIIGYTLRHKPSAIIDAMTYVVSFKHLNIYVHDHLDQILKTKAAAALPQASLEHVLAGKRTLTIAYEELCKHAAAVSKQATVSYEEVKTHVASVSKHAAEEYAELRKQAVSASKHAVTKYEELRNHAATTNTQATAAYEELGKYASALNKQALIRYEELHDQAVTASHQAAMAYEELSKQAAAMSHQTAARYEELREQASLKREQAIAAYEELREQATEISKKIAMIYEELSHQAAAMSKRTATVSKRMATMYRELEEQATSASKKAALFLEELEKTTTALPPPQLVRERLKSIRLGRLCGKSYHMRHF